MATFRVGDAVRVHRDESLFPPKGSWSRYREQPGFVVTVNEDGGPFDTPEYGVILTTTRPPWRQGERSHEVSYDSEAVKWFVTHELVSR